MAERESQPQHEVWLDPGWPTQRLQYRGTDATTAALSYAAAAETITATRSTWRELIWTVDGRTHQNIRNY